MAFAQGQRVWVQATVASNPGSDRIRVNFKNASVSYEDDNGHVRLVVDVGEVQAAPPLPVRFKTGQVYKHSKVQNRYFITHVDGAEVHFCDSHGEQGWFMLGSIMDDALELILDVGE